MVTCYDYWSACIIGETDVDAVLVGDSAAMVMHGHATTIQADVDMMAFHLAAARKGLADKLLIADFPFLAHRRGEAFAMSAVDRFMKLGANAVKIEGAWTTTQLIGHITGSGVPVMGHIGLTPQSVHALGGFTLQGSHEKAAQRIMDEARQLEDAGCFSIVLEMIPATLAQKVTEALSIPTIGIGAGLHTSGQILVLHDLLGLTRNFQPRFLRKYLDGSHVVKEALTRFDDDVKSRAFPSAAESY